MSGRREGARAGAAETSARRHRGERFVRREASGGCSKRRPASAASVGKECGGRRVPRRHRGSGRAIGGGASRRERETLLLARFPAIKHINPAHIMNSHSPSRAASFVFTLFCSVWDHGQLLRSPSLQPRASKFHLRLPSPLPTHHLTRPRPWPGPPKNTDRAPTRFVHYTLPRHAPPVPLPRLKTSLRPLLCRQEQAQSRSRRQHQACKSPAQRNPHRRPQAPPARLRTRPPPEPRLGRSTLGTAPSNKLYPHPFCLPHAANLSGR
ncbi:hypothetical protein BC628DRAFT_662794 [Trametes gibbosa]|nr:hypothetical protein BC628DRAFT_662794 [Trametes gibbosa]